MKLQDETANKALKKKTSSAMITMVNDFIKSTNTTRKSIRTTRRLDSDDICVMTTNEKEANALREHKK